MMALRRGILGNDGNWLVAGIAAVILVPGLTFGLDVPFLVSGVIGAVVFAGIVLVLSPRRLFEGLDARRIGSGRVEFARTLLADAVPAAERLETASERLKDKGVAEKVRHLAEISQDVFAKVEANPERASSVRRFLSYYLPRAAEVAEGYLVLEAKRAPEPARLAEVKDMIGKLEEAFVHYADGLTEADLGTLDTDLRLINASLKEDMLKS